MANKAYKDIIKSGEKVIDYLAETKRSLAHADKMGKDAEDLKHVSSFLTILDGTMKGNEYKMAEADIANAVTELKKFNDQIIEFMGPIGLVKQLQNFKLPEVIESNSIFHVSISDEQYKEYVDQIDKVCNEVTAVVDYFKKM